MTEPPKTMNPVKIPREDIYKVHRLNSSGLTGSILLFCRNTIDNNNISEIFSESEIEEIREKNTELIYANGVLHKDDSISTIKKKILHSLASTSSLVYEEIYLFSLSFTRFQSIYDSLLAENVTLTPEILRQLVENMNLETEERENVLASAEDTLPYDQFRTLLNFETKYKYSIPLGQRFSKERNPLFSANPFRLLSPAIGLPGSKNPLVNLENNLMLNYGELNEQNLYLCTLRDVLQYAESKGTEEEGWDAETLIQTYFPLLYVKSIVSLADFVREEPRLKKSTTDLINSSTLHFFDTIDVFYDVYNSRGEIELPYQSRGIKEMEIRIKSEMNISLPLEVIFKNIHSVKETPMIKYNPGTRRENIYRLYTEKKTADGKHIPYLNESTVIKLSKEIGKKKEISLFLQYTNDKGETIPVFMDLEMNGDVFIRYELKTPLLKEEVTVLTQKMVNPIIQNLNRFLEQTGYKIHTVDSLHDPFIEIVNIRYVAQLELKKDFQWDKYMGCITSVFDVLGENQLLFKRVENFMEMDAQTLMITEVFKRTNDMNQVIQELMKNYKMTEDAGKMRVIQYLGEHKDIRGKIVDNPGFPVALRIDKHFFMEIRNIVSIDYLDTLNVYIDSLLRLVLYTETIPLDKKKILTTCAKRAAIIPNNVENVVTTTIIPPVHNVKQIQAIQLTDDLDEEEEEDEGGIFFEEDEEEEELGPSAEYRESSLEETPSLFAKSPEETPTPEESLFAKSPEEKETPETSSEEKGILFEEETPTPEEESPEEKETPTPEESLFAKSPEEKETPETSSEETPEEKGILFEEETPTPEKEETLTPAPAPTPQKNEEKSPASLSEKGIFFEDEDEKSENDSDEEKYSRRPKVGGKKKLVIANKPPSPPGEEDQGEEEEGTSQQFRMKQIIGKSLKHPNLFYSTMKQRDPELFSVEEDNNYTSYSRVCASNLKLQPVILNQSEFDYINQENPDSYSDYAKYGSDPNNPFYYICPRYWCLLNNTSMTEEDVRQGKCAKKGVPDKIIPKEAKTVPSDAFVYEFNNPKEHLNEKGEYVPHFPGFKKGKHPKGFGLPCCFKKPKQNWEFNQEEAKPKRGRPQKKPEYLERSEAEKNVLYIISYDSFPIRQKNRFGFLPLSVQLFLQTDNNACVTKNNPALIQSNTECFLRYGVEQVLKQSILGTVAEIYAHSQDLATTPTVAQLKDIMKTAITLDKFIFYNNSYLVSVFRPKTYTEIDSSPYTETEFYQKLNISNEYENDFLEDTIASYENFLRFLTSDDSSIDHTYLWDMITDDNPLFIKGGINLVILEIANNDITDNIKILCPTNSNHKKIYDPRKETVILIKRDEFYEPIYIYKENGGKVQKTRTFYAQTPLKNMKKILQIIDKNLSTKCSSLPSNPKTYQFKKPILLETLSQLLTGLNYKVTQQIMNYQGKIIGVLTTPGEDEADAFFVPCFPSAEMKNTPAKWMDAADLWSDYQTTVSALTKLSEASSKKIPCLPKIKVLEDNLVVGFLSETNQFIQIDPPSENIVQDSMPSVSATNYNTADKVITTTKKIDTERETMIQKISLESQFYNIFRTTTRQLLNEFENRETREKIVRLIQNDSIAYKKKLPQVIALVKEMVSYKFSFNTIDEAILNKYHEISCFQGDCEEGNEICMKTEGGTCQLIIPKNHLISGLDNERAYYGRIADELIRYKRIQLFMLHPKTYLNLTNVEYNIHENEFILLQSSLNNNSLKNLVAYNVSENISHSNYGNAQPQITQTYANEPIPLKDQYAADLSKKEGDIQEYIYECVKETKEVIGNPATSSWKRLFPDKSKEIVFKNTSNECSFTVLLYIFQDKYREPVSVQSVKVALWKGYKEIYGKHKDSILTVLKKQGKTDIVQKIKADKYTLETAIMSNEYYITDLDVWVFAQSAKIQVCMFSSFRLKSLEAEMEWLIVGKSYKEKHYFIRVPTNAVANKPASYNLITPAFALGELPDFENQLQGVLSGRGGEKNIQTLAKFLEGV